MMLYNFANGQRHYRLQRVNDGNTEIADARAHLHKKERGEDRERGRERKWQAGMYTGIQTRKTD